LITDLFWVENLRTYVALVVCSFFSLPCTLTDIVIALHPWKDVQAYAAFKCEGTRAYTIGYFSEHEYRVKRRFGQEWSLPCQLFSKAVVFAFKCWMLTQEWSLILAVSCLSSSGSMALGFCTTLKLMYDRKVLLTNLGNLVNQAAPGDGTDSLHQRQVIQAGRLLKKYFPGQKAVLPAQPVGTMPRPTDPPDPKCKRCGRRLHEGGATQPLCRHGNTDVKEDARVRLAENYASFFDADQGVLGPDDVGEVIQAGPELAKLGKRRLVKALTGVSAGAHWWYDEGAIVEARRRWGIFRGDGCRDRVAGLKCRDGGPELAGGAGGLDGSRQILSSSPGAAGLV
jgi:hypothetical protein